MTTALDTSVLLDVLLNDPQHAPASLNALRRASTEGNWCWVSAAKALAPAPPLAAICPMMKREE